MNSDHLTQSQPIAQLPQGVRRCKGWVWVGDIDVLAVVRSGLGSGDDGRAGSDLAVHGSCSSGCGGGSLAVDVLIGDDMAKSAGVGDQTLRRFGRNGLPAFVVAYVALSAAHASGKSRLGNTQLFAD